MRILVTGAAGFAGRHLLRELKHRGHRAFGLVRKRSQFPLIRSLGARPVLGDVTKPGTLRGSVRLSKPDAVAHLAGESYVPAAEADPKGSRALIVEGTRNLLKALPSRTRLLLVSTGMVYGPDRRPAPTERARPRPRNAYARAKLESERAAPDAIVARPFNHAGPGQDPRFVAADFARQVTRIEKGRAPPVLRVGNLSSQRNFLDVRDVARAYVLLLERGRPGRIYNLAGSRPVRIARILAHFRRRCRVPLRVESSARRRGADRLTGSAARMRKELGWSPRIPLERTLDDVLAEWRGKA